MTAQAAAENDSGLEGSESTFARIVVYYSDEAGRKMAHYVKKSS
jgi:hypothetical protein